MWLLLEVTEVDPNRRDPDISPRTVSTLAGRGLCADLFLALARSVAGDHQRGPTSPPCTSLVTVGSVGNNSRPTGTIHGDQKSIRRGKARSASAASAATCRSASTRSWTRASGSGRTTG